MHTVADTINTLVSTHGWPKPHRKTVAVYFFFNSTKDCAYTAQHQTVGRVQAHYYRCGGALSQLPIGCGGGAGSGKSYTSATTTTTCHSCVRVSQHEQRSIGTGGHWQATTPSLSPTPPHCPVPTPTILASQIQYFLKENYSLNALIF